jgi:hypothetical protein
VGRATAPRYSSLHVTGNASLAGTIELDPVIGHDFIGDPIYFFAQAGDAFQVLTYGTRTGTFATSWDKISTARAPITPSLRITMPRT